MFSDPLLFSLFKFCYCIMLLIQARHFLHLFHIKSPLAFQSSNPPGLKINQKLQLLQWPLAGSKSEPVFMDPHVKLTDFTVEINIAAWYKSRLGLYMKMTWGVDFLLDIASANLSH